MGVIDRNGVQWEHCNHCSRMVRLEDLGYERPSELHKCGRDLCVVCADTLLRAHYIRFDQIKPASMWTVVWTVVTIGEET